MIGISYDKILLDGIIYISWFAYQLHFVVPPISFVLTKNFFQMYYRLDPK
jgi:hypothetical protein